MDIEKPYIGASPDGLVCCSCCGEGVIEVKCPLCVREKFPEDDQKTFCMTKVENKWILNAYYYQIQTQMYVCKRDYCDFVVWSEKEGILIDRVAVNHEFFYDIVNDLEHFFKYGILPEIVGKWYTRQPISNSDNVVQTPEPNSDNEVDEEDYQKVWCYCNQPSYGDMIFCENESCTIKWFQCECLRIRKIPKGTWRCPSCRKLPKSRKTKKP